MTPHTKEELQTKLRELWFKTIASKTCINEDGKKLEGYGLNDNNIRVILQLFQETALSCVPGKWIETPADKGYDGSTDYWQALGHDKAIDQFKANIMKLTEEAK